MNIVGNLFHEILRSGTIRIWHEIEFKLLLLRIGQLEMANANMFDYISPLFRRIVTIRPLAPIAFKIQMNAQMILQ